MKRRVWLVIGTCVGAVLFAVPAPASPSAQLTLTGKRTAYVDVTIKVRTAFDFAHATVSGGGSYVGVYAEAIDKPVSERPKPGASIGLIQIRDYHGPGESSYEMQLGSDPYLMPGRYRFYLVADGPAIVRLPVSGAMSTSLHPRHATYAQAAVAPNALLNPLEASNKQHMSVRGTRSVSLSTITVGRFHAYAGQIEACLTFPGKACGSATSTSVDGTYTGWFVSPINTVDFTWLIGYAPGALKPGNYDAVQSALNATTIQFATSAAFTLALA